MVPSEAYTYHGAGGHADDIGLSAELADQQQRSVADKVQIRRRSRDCCAVIGEERACGGSNRMFTV